MDKIPPNTFALSTCEFQEILIKHSAQLALKLQKQFNIVEKEKKHTQKNKISKKKSKKTFFMKRKCLLDS